MLNPAETAASAVADAPMRRLRDVDSEGFRPAPALRSPHLQTLWPTLMRRVPVTSYVTEIFELEDGDFLELDHATPADAVPATDPPLAIVLHGLQGSRRSSYARGMLARLAQMGWRAVLMHFRGCGGSPNRLARSYNAGDTGDLRVVLAALRERFAPPYCAAIGYSLGGNVLLRYLAETGDQALIDCGVAVSVPYQLDRCAARLDRGASRLYREYLLRSMRAALRAKFLAPSPPATPPAFDIERALRARSMFDFDDAATAPLHGFAGADEYYTWASSRPLLPAIAQPTLLLHAADDPFMSSEVPPTTGELSASTHLELSAHGGHVGFIERADPALGHSGWWLERRIPAWLAAHRTAVG